VRLLRLWADTVVMPPEKPSMPQAGCGELVAKLHDLRHIHEQNQDLQKTIDRLRLEQASLLEDAKQGERLQALMDFQQKYIYKTQAAQASEPAAATPRGFSTSTRALTTSWSATWP